MISKAEQQFITKLQDPALLQTEYRAHVHTKEKMINSAGEDFTAELIAKDLQLLGVDCTCVFEDGTWEITLGGKATKKKVNMRGETLDTIMAKSLIIYARKYL